MAEEEQVKKLSEVSNKLSQLNRTQDADLGNIKALTQTLVDQGKATLQTQESIASAEAEARREASRARKDKAGVQDVNVLNWQNNEEGGGFMSGLMDFFSTRFAFKGLKAFSLGTLFSKGGILKMLSALGLTIFTNIKTAFAAVGTKFSTFLGPTLMKFLSPMALITGLVLAIKDGFAGAMSAMDWGVSKISGFLGGFFGGDADGGIMNAFKNAGKWALIGAGIGSVVPVVGTLLGGLVGMAIGGILGLIGAKKIARAFDALGTFLSEKWTAVSEFVKEIWGKITGWFSEQWEKVKEWFFTSLSWATEGISAGWTSLSAFVSGKWAEVKKWFEDLLTFESEGGEKIGIGEKIIELFKSIPDKIVQLFKDMIANVQKIFSNISMPWEDSPEEKKKEQNEKRVEIEKEIAEHKKEIAAGDTRTWRGVSREDQIAKLEKELAAMPEIATGGPILRTGPAVVHEGELMLDNHAASVFMQAASTLAQLQREKSEINNTMSPPVTIVNQSTGPSIINQQQSMLLPEPNIVPQSTNRLPS